MFKKLATILLFCLISSFAFAQTAPRQVLSERDINNFIANYDRIMDAIDELGDKYDHLFAELGEADGLQALIRIRSIAVPAEIQNILINNGLGENGFEKAMVIIQAIGLIYMEEAIDGMAGSTDPGVAEYIRELRNGIKPLRDSINNNDLALINRRKAELFRLLD